MLFRLVRKLWDKKPPGIGDVVLVNPKWNRVGEHGEYPVCRESSKCAFWEPDDSRCVFNPSGKLTNYKGTCVCVPAVINKMTRKS